ncbi:MAG: adenylosuccinate synthetase [Caldilineaceae bacterium]|nr:adenylosuccinate synthetase [Caldilineaceae bacterium]
MNQVFLTVDLGFGDAGKGSIVDYLVRSHAAHTVVRYNGGAQAGHRVVAVGEDGTLHDHVFAQFGSGTLAGAATHLSRFMLLDPLAMLQEETHLHTLGIADAFARTTIDQDALVITPFQRAINRLRELARGDGRHGSCGMGIGETVADALRHSCNVVRAGDLLDRQVLHKKLAFLRQINREKVEPLRGALPDNAAVAAELDLLCAADWHDWLLDAYADFAAVAQIVPGEHLHKILQRPGTVVFEGAQGVLLDEWRGFHPHTTWSTTTLANAAQLLNEAAYSGQVTRIGITRAYATRHGAGPLVTEDADWTAALPDACNGNGAWQQGFRVGPLDFVTLRYAVDAVGTLDALAVTCLDRLPAARPIPICRAYRDASGHHVARLTPSPLPRDLSYQAKLTQRLFACRPILNEVADHDELLFCIEETLGIRVGIGSYGPVASAKVLRIHLPLF